MSKTSVNLLSTSKVVLQFIVQLSFARLAMLADDVDENVGIRSSIGFVASKHRNFVLVNCNITQSLR
jgi:hypothetical protein